MSDAAADDLLAQKAAQRRRAYDARNAQPDKDAVSRVIVDAFMALPGYASAGTVMWYLDARSEVRTRHRVADALGGGKRIVVPYSTVDERGANKLGLWHLAHMDELVVGQWKILEPPRERWGEPGKEVPPGELDLVMVPGVGFSPEGGRMGNGQGYYDRLLAQARADAPLVALAFECQMFPDLVVGAHDIYMDKVVTEKAVYAGRGRAAR